MEEGEQVPGSSEFGTLLRRYRIAANLSQEALAERARMSVNGLGSLERGDRRTPRRETLALLSDALALNAEQRWELKEAASRSSTGRRAVAADPWFHSETANLPLALTSFVGRDRELAEIGALLRGHRMVTLTGAGGVGKTQTALHAASSIDESVQGPVCFVGLASIDNPSQVVAAIASTLGVQEVPHRALLETLSIYLKNKAMLLILDNCEHVIAQAAITADALLVACPRVRILATSRESLRAAGEYNYRLPTLGFPSPKAAAEIRAEDASTYGAIVLFADRANAVDHRFILSDENAPVVTGLCRRLDGIPLAIELAAARVNQLSVKAIAEKLDDRFRILTRGERTAMPRQQTMRATIDWSYNLLSASEQRAFERLSVFAGGCTLDTAASVCGDETISAADVLDVLSSLVDKSLLGVDLEGNEPRYRLLESFRQYAREKLAARGEQDLVAHRHALAYRELAHRTGGYDHFAPNDALSRARFREEVDNWRAAVHWALTDCGDVVLGQQLAAELCGVWSGRGTPLEARHWITSAIELVNEDTPTSLIADLNLAKATAAWHLREHKDQLASSQEAISRYRVVGDSLRVARAQSLAGHALVGLGRIEEAQPFLQETLQNARDSGHLLLVAFVLRCLAYASAAEHNIVAARDYIAEALVIYQAEADKRDEAHMTSLLAWALIDLAEYELGAGNVEPALLCAIDVLGTARKCSPGRLVAATLNIMAICLVWLGRYDEAEKCAKEALDLEREGHWETMVSWSLQHLAAVAAFRPQPDEERMNDQYARTAKIVGFVDARLAALGSPRTPEMVPEYDRVLAVLCETLGADALRKFMASGAAMTQEQALEQASAND